MRTEIDAARVGEIDRWTLERYEESFERGHHTPFRDCAERPLMVGIAEAHGAVLDSPCSSGDRGAVVIVLDEAKRSLHAELLGCRASDPGWWIARIYPAPMRPEMDRRSRLPSPRRHARDRDLVHDDSRGAFVPGRAVLRYWPVHAAALAILLAAAALRSKNSTAHLWAPGTSPKLPACWSRPTTWTPRSWLAAGDSRAWRRPRRWTRP